MPKPSVQLLPQTKPEPLLVTSTKVTALLDERLEVAAKLDQLTEKKRALDAAILHETVTRTKRKDGVIETDDYTVTAVNASNSHIDKKALVDAGVKLSVIEAATKVTPYAYPRITRKKPTMSADEILKGAVQKARGK